MQSRQPEYFFCIQTTYLPLLNIGGSALAAEICAGPHHRLLRSQHCSSLCLQSEGHEHVANMVSALAHDFVKFLAVFGRHNIRSNSRPPHFASKVSYNAGAATDDVAGQRKSPLRGRCCQYLIFYLEHPPIKVIAKRNHAK